MKFAGIGTLNNLLSKHAVSEFDKIYNEHEEFFDAFFNNLNIEEETLSIIPIALQPADPSVGIFESYIDEMGASVMATTWVPKEDALEIVLEVVSIDKYIEESLAKIMSNLDIYDTIVDIFVDALDTVSAEEAGMERPIIDENVRENFRCIVKKIENSDDNKSIIFLIEFST